MANKKLASETPKAPKAPMAKKAPFQDEIVVNAAESVEEPKERGYTFLDKPPLIEASTTKKTKFEQAIDVKDLGKEDESGKIWTKDYTELVAVEGSRQDVYGFEYYGVKR